MELASLERQIVGLTMNNLPMQDTLDKITVMKARITQMYLDQDIVKAQTRRKERYEFSEKVGKLLAYNTRQRVTQDAIITIMDSQGQIVRGNLVILKVFKDYISALYQQENHPLCDIGGKISQYLNETPGPWLSDENRQLATPILPDEITAALSSLPNGKATGPNMILMKCFKTFFEELKDYILAWFLSVQDGVQAPGS
ncbi:hypothetical protein NDU88_005365, partial [Pleurodeles waltl]